MTKLYKLTREDFTTHNNTKWGEGVTHYGTGKGELYGPGWIHAYTDPLLAIFLKPLHVNYDPYLLWECEGEVVKIDHGLKVGCLSLTTVRQINKPTVTTNNSVTFGILCATEVYKELKFLAWADDWLKGKDRTAATATAADAAAYAAAYAHAAAYRAALDLISIANKAITIQ